MTEEHEKCVKFCQATTKRAQNGKLEVSLPFNMNTNDHDFLGDTRRMALKRFHYLEKKFEKNTEFHKRYKADMLSYLQCNHFFDTLIRWRTHKIALVTDIEKTYRQISLAPEDRKYQKILWRFSKEEPIQTYEISTVMFGVKPAPYLAINATFVLADMEQKNYPEASKRVKTDFYVDDGMSGSDSIESAKALQQELNGLFNAGHMH